MARARPAAQQLRGRRAGKLQHGLQLRAQRRRRRRGHDLQRVRRHGSGVLRRRRDRDRTCDTGLVCMAAGAAPVAVPPAAELTSARDDRVDKRLLAFLSPRPPFTHLLPLFVKSMCSAFPSRSRKLTCMTGAAGSRPTAWLMPACFSRATNAVSPVARNAKCESCSWAGSTEPGAGRAAGFDLDQVDDRALAAVEPRAPERERRPRAAHQAQDLGVERCERIDALGADVDVIERVEQDGSRGCRMLCPGVDRHRTWDADYGTPKSLASGTITATVHGHHPLSGVQTIGLQSCADLPALRGRDCRRRRPVAVTAAAARPMAWSSAPSGCRGPDLGRRRVAATADSRAAGHPVGRVGAAARVLADAAGDARRGRVARRAKRPDRGATHGDPAHRLSSPWCCSR